MSDQNFDNRLDALLAESAPTPDTLRKKTIIEQSKLEFSQAFTSTNRPIKEGGRQSGNSKAHSLWRFIMSPIENKRPYQVLATATVAFFTLSLVMFLPRIGEDQAVMTSTTQKSVIEPVTDALVSADTPTTSSGQPKKQASNVSKQETKTKRADTITAEYLAEESLEQDSANGKVEKRASISESFSEGLIQSDKKSFQKARQGGLQTSRTRPQEGHVAPQRPDAAEQYASYQANDIIQVAEQPVSTFSADVDTASYSLVRNQLNRGLLPKPQAVRAEELINYFNYDYALPDDKSRPFKPSINVLNSPWNPGRKLVHIGIKGFDIKPSEQPDSNLVFLLDVSGSMNDANKLPLVKQSLGLLLDSLKPTDNVSIVVYAGAAGTVLEPTAVKDKNKILQSLESLQAGGSTAGGQGLRLAYQLAEQNFKKKCCQSYHSSYRWRLQCGSK